MSAADGPSGTALPGLSVSLRLAVARPLLRVSLGRCCVPSWREFLNCRAVYPFAARRARVGAPRIRRMGILRGASSAICERDLDLKRAGSGSGAVPRAGPGASGIWSELDLDFGPGGCSGWAGRDSRWRVGKCGCGWRMPHPLSIVIRIIKGGAARRRRRRSSSSQYLLVIPGLFVSVILLRLPGTDDNAGSSEEDRERAVTNL